MRTVLFSHTKRAKNDTEGFSRWTTSFCFTHIKETINSIQSFVIYVMNFKWFASFYVTINLTFAWVKFINKQLI